MYCNPRATAKSDSPVCIPGIPRYSPSMATHRNIVRRLAPLRRWLTDEGAYFARPVQVLGNLSLADLRPDLIAGLTVAVVLLPQAIAEAMVAELPPQMGIYTAVVAAVVGALWGSSRHLHTGPTNASSLLVLATLLTVATPGTHEFVIAAGVLAVLVGIIKVVMGLARMGTLVNFVSDSVIVGFTAGAAVLISVNQLRHLLKLDVASKPMFLETAADIGRNLDSTHGPSMVLGIATLVLVMTLRRLKPRWPGALIAMVLAAVVAALLHLDERGVVVLGELPRTLPPLTSLPMFNLELVGRLAAGALAIAAIGLVEAISISRVVAAQSGQRLDSNQEFVGQGLASIACGFLSGYTASGSFTRTAVNYGAGGRQPLAAMSSGLWVLVALFLLAPLAVYLPQTAVVGVLLATAYGMIDWREIRRIMRSSRGDSTILIATFVSTLTLPLEFAVLAGMFVSFGRYLMRTSTPLVHEVVPDDTYAHLLPLRNQRPGCPQLGIVEIEGSLYFGAVSHVEDELTRMRERRPGLVFLLLRMQRVNHCDVSGIHMLEALVRRFRDRGGDVFLEGVRPRVLHLMSLSGFLRTLGHRNVLRKNSTIGHLFHNVLHPGICIYECEHRVFAECQTLPKHSESLDHEMLRDVAGRKVIQIRPSEVRRLMEERPGTVVLIDVGEEREFMKWHVPNSINRPLSQLSNVEPDLPTDLTIVAISRIGRRSTLAAQILLAKGYPDVRNLHGGVLGWEAAGYPIGVE